MNIKNIKSVLLFLISANYAWIFVKNGWAKFDSEGFWSGAFIDRWGYGLYFMYFIGVLEFLGGIGILIPKANKYAAFTLALVMLGAAVTRLVFGTSADDVIWIVSTMATLGFIAVEKGIAVPLLQLKNKLRGNSGED